MMWGDEPYVRIYRRDTVDLVAMGWEARACLWELLRHADRSGTIELGKHGLRGLAATIHMPLDVVEQAIPILVTDGCIRLGDDRIAIPNYIPAQEANRSDAARKRDERERKRQQTIDVTSRDTASRSDVEETDGTSRPVHGDEPPRDQSHEMSLCAVQCSAVQDSAVHTHARATDGQANAGDNTDPPGWFLAAVATVEMGTEPIADKRLSWIRYSGHRKSKGKAMSQADAQQWLVTVDVKEAREARRRSNGTTTIKQAPAPSELAPWRDG